MLFLAKRFTNAHGFRVRPNIYQVAGRCTREGHVDQGGRPHEMDQLDTAGAVLTFHGYANLTQPHLYDEKIGLSLLKVDGVLLPEALMC